jgi:hypothetical protein
MSSSGNLTQNSLISGSQLAMSPSVAEYGGNGFVRAPRTPSPSQRYEAVWQNLYARMTTNCDIINLTPAEYQNLDQGTINYVIEAYA